MKQLFWICLIIALFSLHTLGQSGIQASENLALIEVVVMDMNKKPRADNFIIFQSKQSSIYYRGQSDKTGKFEIVLPKGDTYQVSIEALVDNIDFEQLHIPAQKGMIKGQFQICYQAAQSYTLEDVFFETAKATLKANSFKALEEVVAAMNAKPHLDIEIAGHTDALGAESANQQLSENRAKAVVTFLINKGIKAKRLKAVGYGETQPIADNDSEAGRSRNRRTEARILSKID